MQPFVKFHSFLQLFDKPPFAEKEQENNESVYDFVKTEKKLAKRRTKSLS